MSALTDYQIAKKAYEAHKKLCEAFDEYMGSIDLYDHNAIERELMAEAKTFVEEHEYFFYEKAATLAQKEIKEIKESKRR